MNNASYNATSITFPTITTAGTTAVPVQGYYAPPKRWHNFPCGHQVELEQTQPIPGACHICGPAKPPEMETYTYKRCGHPFSHAKGVAVPAECPTCMVEAQNRRDVAAAEEARRAEEMARREAEDREPLAWLDKQVGDLCGAGVV